MRGRSGGDTRRSDRDKNLTLALANVRLRLRPVEAAEARMGLVSASGDWRLRSVRSYFGGAFLLLDLLFMRARARTIIA